MEKLKSEKINIDTPKERLANADRGETAIDSAREKAREEAAYWAREYYDAEVSFAKRAEKSDIEYEEFLKWEDDARTNYRRMQEYENQALFSSRYERDRAEKFGILDAGRTLEAKSGDFYLRRQRALNRAIEESGSPDGEKDLLASQDLYRYVGEHIYYETDYDTRRFDVDSYQANRRRAHNNLIEQLNHMNDLAEKYGVQRFTLRNFETNDFPYDRNLDSGGYTDRRAEYDRATVEAYCRNAFSSQYDKAMRENGL